MGLYMFIKQIWGNIYTYYSFVETHADFAGHLIISFVNLKTFVSTFTSSPLNLATLAFCTYIEILMRLRISNGTKSIGHSGENFTVLNLPIHEFIAPFIVSFHSKIM